MLAWTSAIAVSRTASGSNALRGQFLVGEGEHVGGDLLQADRDLGLQLPLPAVEALFEGLPVVGLPGPGDHRGLLLQPVQFQRVGFAAVALLEHPRQLGRLRGDRAGPAGEQVVDRLLGTRAARGPSRPGASRPARASCAPACSNRPRSAIAPAAGRCRYRLASPGCATAHPRPGMRQNTPLWMCSCGSFVRAGVLEERGDGPLVRVDEPARAAAVVPDPGVAGVLLQVVQGGVVARPDRVLDRLPVRRPRRGRLQVTGRAGFHLLVLRTRRAARSPTFER